MVFSSVVFIFYFLPVFLIAYYLTGARNAVLLTGSAIFYVWGEGLYLFLLIGLLLINFWAGKQIDCSEGRRRKWLLFTFVSVNIGVLAVFKYSQFLVNIVTGALQMESVHLGIHLPLGISFFIFQLVSYLIEVNRRTIESEKSLYGFQRTS